MKLRLHFFGSVALCAVAGGLQLGAICQADASAQRAAARAFIEQHHCVPAPKGAWRCDNGLWAITETP